MVLGSAPQVFIPHSWALVPTDLPSMSFSLFSCWFNKHLLSTCYGHEPLEHCSEGQYFSNSSLTCRSGVLGPSHAHVQIHSEWHPVSCLKSAMVEKFTAQTPANTTDRCSFLFPKGLVVSHLPAHSGLNLKSHSPLGWEGGIPLPQALVTYMPLHFHSFIHSLSKCLLINCHVIGPVCRRQPLFFSQQLFSSKNVGLVLLDLIFFFKRDCSFRFLCRMTWFFNGSHKRFKGLYYCLSQSKHVLKLCLSRRPQVCNCRFDPNRSACHQSPGLSNVLFPPVVLQLNHLENQGHTRSAPSSILCLS